MQPNLINIQLTLTQILQQSPIRSQFQNHFKKSLKVFKITDTITYFSDNYFLNITISHVLGPGE